MDARERIGGLIADRAPSSGRDRLRLCVIIMRRIHQDLQRGLSRADVRQRWERIHAIERGFPRECRARWRRRETEGTQERSPRSHGFDRRSINNAGHRRRRRNRRRHHRRLITTAVGLATRGLASLTVRRRPSCSFSFNPWIAAWAWSSESISTKPKPLLRPVSRSVITWASARSRTRRTTTRGQSV